MVKSTGLAGILQYIKKDWQSNPWRLAGEMYNWFTSVLSSLVFAITVPNPPFMLLYPIWLSGLTVMIFCAISRGSTGILAVCLSMLAIDLIGLCRLILQAVG